jgi:hypothetical protein
MTWVQRLLKRYSEDARFRFILGAALAILLLAISAIRWG